MSNPSWSSAVDSRYSIMRLCNRMHASMICMLCAKDHCKDRNSISPNAYSTAIWAEEYDRS
jgi:hypothetical protein